MFENKQVNQECDKIQNKQGVLVSKPAEEIAVFKAGRKAANVLRIVFIALAIVAFIVLAFMLIGFLISEGPERIMGEKSILLVLFSAVVFLLLASLPFRSVVKEATKNVRKGKK